MNNEDKLILERLVVAEERGKSNTHRIDTIEEDVESMKSNTIKISQHDEDIRILKDQSSTIYRLAVNQEAMTNTLNNIVDDNRRQMGQFTETLGNMNDSLTNMNNSQQEMSNEIKNMQKDITSTKEHIEEVEVIANTNSSRGKLDLITFFSDNVTKTVVIGVIMTLLGAGLTYIGIP